MLQNEVNSGMSLHHLLNTAHLLDQNSQPATLKRAGGMADYG